KNRFHPVQKRFKAHLGTDYAAPTGTPIYTVGDGTVIEKGYTSGNGNYVKIKHNATYTTQYLHMSKFASGLSKGDRVTQGEVIGYVGSTGLATGPHLCYRFWKNGVQVDPFQEKIPPSFPVKAAMLDTYRAMAGKEMRILENTPVNLAPEEKVIHEYIVMLDTLGVLPAIQFLIPSSIGI
ncbi:MAG: M23 family metallopeptidase, partial [Chitinophagales bacterium]